MMHGGSVFHIQTAPLKREFLKAAIKLPLRTFGVLQEICMVEIIGGLPYGGKLKPVPFQSSGS